MKRFLLSYSMTSCEMRLITSEWIDKFAIGLLFFSNFSIAFQSAVVEINVFTNINAVTGLVLNFLILPFFIVSESEKLLSGKIFGLHIRRKWIGKYNAYH